MDKLGDFDRYLSYLHIPMSEEELKAKMEYEMYAIRHMLTSDIDSIIPDRYKAFLNNKTTNRPAERIIPQWREGPSGSGSGQGISQLLERNDVR